MIHFAIQHILIENLKGSFLLLESRIAVQLSADKGETLLIFQVRILTSWLLGQLNQREKETAVAVSLLRVIGLGLSLEIRPRISPQGYTLATIGRSVFG